MVGLFLMMSKYLYLVFIDYKEPKLETMPSVLKILPSKV